MVKSAATWGRNEAREEEGLPINNAGVADQKRGALLSYEGQLRQIKKGREAVKEKDKEGACVASGPFVAVLL